MAVVDDPDQIPEVQQEFQKVIDREENKHWPLVKIERHAFYERAKKSVCHRHDRRATSIRLRLDQEGRRFEHVAERPLAQSLNRRW